MIETVEEWERSNNPRQMWELFFSDTNKNKTRFPKLSISLCRAFVQACRNKIRAMGKGNFSWSLEEFENVERKFDAALGYNWENSAEVWARSDLGYGQILPMSMRATYLRDLIGNPFRPMIVVHGDGSQVPPGYGISVLPRDWLTPTVLSLAQAAYENRLVQKCISCKGKGERRERREKQPCPHCGILVPHNPRRNRKGTGYIQLDTLEPINLAILADALEEAGCPSYVACNCPNDWCSGTKRNPFLQHLRSPSPHLTSCWALKLILGQEGPWEPAGAT